MFVVFATPTALDSTMSTSTSPQVVEKVNLEVAVRCRPLNTGDLGQANVMSTAHNAVTASGKTYSYDQVFGPEASQAAVFTGAVLPTVRKMFKGYNCTVFAYGQTSSGKTYTMQGELLDADHMGVIPRSVHTIFEHLNTLGADHTVRASFLEIYNEELTDLLVDTSKLRTAVNGPVVSRTALKLQEDETGSSQPHRACFD